MISVESLPQRFYFPRLMNDKTLSANQNPSSFKEPEHLKQQMIKLFIMLIINRTILFIGVDANVCKRYWSHYSRSLLINTNSFFSL